MHRTPRNAVSSVILAIVGTALLRGQAAAPAVRPLQPHALSDGTVYAGQSGASGFSGDGQAATKADLNLPADLAVDSAGNLYIGDTFNNRIRKVSAATGVITTYAGTGQIGAPGMLDGEQATSANIQLPGTIAIDGSDNLYFYQSAPAPNILKISASTGIISSIVPTSVLNNFFTAIVGVSGGSVGLSMAVDRTGSTIWLAAKGQILKIAVASGTVTPYPTGGSQFSAVALEPNGDAIFPAVTPPGNPFLPHLARINATTGEITTVYDSPLPTAPGVSQTMFPIALAVDASGNIFFSNLFQVNDTDADTIFKIDPSGTLTEVAQTPLLTVTDSPNPTIVPNSLAADAAGNLYFAENDHTVHRLSVAAFTPPPSISAGGVLPAGSGASSISSGEWVSIYGTNLASRTAVWAGDFPAMLGGSSVTVDGKPAFLSFVSPGQINFQAPDDSTTGPVQVVVTTASGSSALTVTLSTVAPSFLLLDTKHVAGIIVRSDHSGAYGGGAYDIIGPTGSSLGYSTVAAKAGDTIELFGTGFGPTTPAVPAGQPFSSSATNTNPVTLQINGMKITPSFAGLSGAGLEQINFTVPSGLGSGDVPLTAMVNGVQTSSSVVISLQ